MNKMVNLSGVLFKTGISSNACKLFLLTSVAFSSSAFAGGSKFDCQSQNGQVYFSGISDITASVTKIINEPIYDKDGKKQNIALVKLTLQITLENFFRTLEHQLEHQLKLNELR